MAPTVSIGFTLTPSTFSLGDKVELSATVVSHASEAITIFTFLTILNFDYAQSQATFGYVDLNTDANCAHIRESCYGYGCVPDRVRGGKYDQYFMTLMPEQPQVIRRTFEAAQSPTCLSAGHSYHFELILHEEYISSWWSGLKEKNMAWRLPFAPVHLKRPRDAPIVLDGFEPLELRVLPASDAIEDMEEDRLPSRAERLQALMTWSLQKRASLHLGAEFGGFFELGWSLLASFGKRERAY